MWIKHKTLERGCGNKCLGRMKEAEVDGQKRKNGSFLSVV